MKVKVLLVPLFIVLSVALSIWLVYPAFSDWSMKKEELEKEKGKVADIKMKLEKTEALAGVLKESSRSQEIVNQFLPESQRVEEIFDSLSSIASSEGMAISEISVEKPKIKIQALNLPPEVTGQNAISATEVSSSDPSNQESASISKVSLFEANLFLKGNYEKAKAILSKIGQMKRFNNVSSLEISADKSEGASADNLLVKMVFDFGYLEKVKSVSSVNNRIFSSSGFETESLMADLEKHKNGFSSKINLEGVGKANPFLP
ncbi:MAG: hypothetical protein ACOYS2_03860 [Patescibacteria group bacterium]